jgi:hypothetical protein
VVYREEFRAAFPGLERDQAKAGARPEAHPAGFPAEQAAGQARDWDYPVSARDCSDQDQARDTPKRVVVDLGVDAGRLQHISSFAEEDHPG